MEFGEADLSPRASGKTVDGNGGETAGIPKTFKTFCESVGNCKPFFSRREREAAQKLTP